MFLELHFTPNFSKLDLFFLWQFVPMVMAIQATEAAVSVSVQLNLKLIDMLDTAALLVCWWCLNLFRLVDCSSWTLAAAAGRWFAPKTFSKLKQFSCETKREKNTVWIKSRKHSTTASLMLQFFGEHTNSGVLRQCQVKLDQK